MEYKDFNKEKQDFFEKAKVALFKKVAKSQNLLFSLLVDVITNMDLGVNDKIKFTAKNISKAQEVNLIIEVFEQKQNRSITQWMGQKIFTLLGLNKKYFKTIKSSKPQSADDKVRILTMQRLGYDPIKKNVIKGGWLDSFSKNTGIANKVGDLLNQGISAKMDVKTFQKQFKSVFIDPNGLGMLERHYYTNTFDIFQQYDRQIGKEYADRMNLNFAIYSGAIKGTTRPFCKKRNNRVYSKKEIESWKDIDFQGKPKIYNPVTMLGGHNCRHHLSWISDELANDLGNIDTYK